MIRVMDMSSGESCDVNLHEFGMIKQTKPHSQRDIPRPQLQLALQEVFAAERDRRFIIQHARPLSVKIRVAD